MASLHKKENKSLEPLESEISEIAMLLVSRNNNELHEVNVNVKNTIVIKR